MAAFTTVGPGWLVEDIGDECYHVYAVWLWSGKKFCGVASGDGMEELLETSAIADMKRAAPTGIAEVPHTVRFRCVRVGPTPGKSSANAQVEVRVIPDGKGGWAVEGIRDIRPKRPRKKVAL